MSRNVRQRLEEDDSRGREQNWQHCSLQAQLVRTVQVPSAFKANGVCVCVGGGLIL